MRLRAILAIALASISLTIPAQEPPATGTKTFALGLQEPSGDGSHMEWKWTTKEAQGQTLPVFDCVRACSGGKHPKHTGCDLSCDSACPANASPDAHFTWVAESVSELGATGDAPPTRRHGETLSRDFTTFRLPSTMRGGPFLSHLGYIFRGGARAGSGVFSLKAPHWNEAPCSISSARIPADSYLVTVQYVIYDTKLGANNALTRAEGPKGTLRWRMLVPIKGATIERGTPVVTCRCEATQEPPKETGFLPGNRGEGAYAYVSEMGMRRSITGLDLRAAITAVTAHDMNYATLTFMPLPMREYYIPDGWELECVEGGAQDLQIIDWTFISDMPRFEFASLNGAQSPTQEKKLRVLCLNIDKPEPRPGMIFRLVPPRNPIVARVAAVTKNSRIRGPWDQMRLWIATDAATYDKIAKTLIPSPGPGTYVREMHRAASARAINPFDDRCRPMMEYRHLLAKSYDPAAVAWYLTTKLRQDAPATIRWLRGSQSEIAAVFGQGSPKEEAELLGILASTLATALWLLSEATPEANRAAVAESTGAHQIAFLLIALDDAKAADQILAWLATAKPSFSGIAASNVDANLPATTQAKAKAIRDSLKLAGTTPSSP